MYGSVGSVKSHCIQLLFFVLKVNQSAANAASRGAQKRVCFASDTYSLLLRSSSSDCMLPALLQDSDTQLLRERAATILWIKTQMARYGLHLADLQNAGCFAEGASLANAPVHPIRYRDAYGHAWDGHGDLPEWLRRAVNAGQSIEHFRVKP